MQAEIYELNKEMEGDYEIAFSKCDDSSCMDMGLAAGGLMEQEIAEDEHGIEVWDTTASSRCYIHIANSNDYKNITGNNPPHKPPTATKYTDAGLPWFDYYDENATAVPGAKKLARLDSVAAKGIKKGEKPLPTNEPVSPKEVINLKPKKSEVRDGHQPR